MRYDPNAPMGHVMYAILNARLMNWPYPHAYMENVFPRDFYEDMMDHMPAPEEYDADEFGHMDVAERYRRSIRLSLDAEKFPEKSRDFWSSMMEWFLGEGPRAALMNKFGAQMKAKFAGEMNFYSYGLLSHDKPGYWLGAHTDQALKTITCVFYLPPYDDYDESLGTSMYMPLGPTKNANMDYHYEFTSFARVKTAPYRPNSAFMFFKGDNSWHGVEEAETARTAIQLQVLAEKEGNRKVDATIKMATERV